MANAKRRITVPGTNIRILEWFTGYFASVYCILHPLIAIESEHAWILQTPEGPTRAQLQAYAHPVTWTRVIQLAGLQNMSALHRILQDSIGALRRADPHAVQALHDVLAQHHLVVPEEGTFPDLLVDEYFSSLADLDYLEAVVGDEWGERATKRPIAAWLSRPFPDIGEFHPTLYTEDHQVLYGVQWDSFFTFLCSSQSLINQILLRHPFEGFFCGPDTWTY